jgi:two-component system nitrogen regulation response regulator GlnG
VVNRVGERLRLDALLVGKAVALSRSSPSFVRPGGAPSIPLTDPFLSNEPLVFAPGPEGSIWLDTGAGNRVAIEGAPLQGIQKFGPEELAMGVTLELAGRVVLLLHTVPSSMGDTSDSLGMVGGGLQHVRDHIEHVADQRMPVLIRGERSTGKELVAHAIHQRSRRRDQRFITVSLGAIPKELAAAELFGAQKGAFSGATQREGFFRAAQGGTLVLDQVDEAPPEVQVMLLRVLETGEFYPVGGSTPISTDVRLIVTTDANLEELVRQGRFKAPLLHRLAGYEIHVPPLRERREDIGPLFFHFARQELESIGEAHRLETQDPMAEPWLPAELAALLVRYSWPGNVRELRNLTRQLIIRNRGRPSLRLDSRLGVEVSTPAPVPPTEDAKVVPRRRLSEITEGELREALRACTWDLKATAERLGIVPRSAIYDLIQKHPNIRTAGDLGVEEIIQCFHECRGDLDAMVRRLEVSKRALRRRINELGLAKE